MLGDYFSSKGALLKSVVLFSFLPLVPWVAVFTLGAEALHASDGPAAFALLTGSAVGTLLAQAVYCCAAFLVGVVQVRKVWTFLSACLLCVIIVFCAGSSFIWAKVSMDGGVLFGLAAVLYAAFGLKVMRDLVSMLCLRLAKKTIDSR